MCSISLLDRYKQELSLFFFWSPDKSNYVDMSEALSIKSNSDDSWLYMHVSGPTPGSNWKDDTSDGTLRLIKKQRRIGYILSNCAPYTSNILRTHLASKYINPQTKAWAGDLANIITTWVPQKDLEELKADSVNKKLRNQQIERRNEITKIASQALKTALNDYHITKQLLGENK